jgi:hypothetical protein
VSQDGPDKVANDVMEKMNKIANEAQEPFKQMVAEMTDLKTIVAKKIDLFKKEGADLAALFEKIEQKWDEKFDFKFETYKDCKWRPIL